MRIANLNDRLSLVIGGGHIDVEIASGGRFGADAQAVYDDWAQFAHWAAGLDTSTATPIPSDAVWGAPTPRPRQAFAIGLNYRDHAAESGFDAPTNPAVFTKFPTSLTGHNHPVVLPTETVDWEVELVAVIGARCVHVSEQQAWDHVAGVTVGQDLSERRLQLSGPAPQFSLGKSYPGFAPVGPELITVDELPDRDNLEIGCALEGGEILQKGRTSDLIFTVPRLIAHLSAVCPLLPGDLIFTGTPSGVGGARKPPKFLAPGDVLTSWIEGVGTLRTPLMGR